MRLSEVRLFLKQAIAEPTQIGGVFPSSMGLAEAMAEATLAHPGPYAEFGPGTGRVIDALIAKGVLPQDLTSYELSTEFARALKARHPALEIVNAPAQTITERFVGELGAIVSGLPLLSIPLRVQRQIVSAAFEALRPEGVFIQYTFGPRPSVARSVLMELGLRYEKRQRVLCNLPPARVYLFRRG